MKHIYFNDDEDEGSDSEPFIIPEDQAGSVKLRKCMDEGPHGPTIISKAEALQIWTKQLLVNKVFLGIHKKRCYVPLLHSFRDVVHLSVKEKGLKRDLQAVKNMLESVYSSNTWIGITDAADHEAPAEINLWVTLKNAPLGKHWFRIREVQFLEREILVRLKCIHSLDPRASPNVETRETEILEEKTKTEAKEQNRGQERIQAAEENPLNDIVPKTVSFIKSIKYDTLVYEFLQNCYSMITLKNMKTVMAFFIITITASITGFFQLVKYIGDFSLKLTREVSVLIHSLTPLILGIFDLLSKVIGGFYILLAMIWRDYRRPQPPQGPPLNHPRQFALPAPSFRKGDTRFRPNMNY